MINTDVSASPKSLLWRQEVNIFGNKMMMDTAGTQKMWGVKVYDTYKNFRNIKIQYMSIRRPFILKLLILAEVGVWAYSNFGNYNLNRSINDLIVKHPIYKIFKKDNTIDYIVNIALYGTLGKTLFITNKTVYYSLFLLGAPISYFLYKINGQVKDYVEEKVNIEDFDLFHPSANIMPKMILSSSIMLYLNYFLKNDRLKLMNNLTVDKKIIFIFTLTYFISKFLQFSSNFTTESIKYLNIYLNFSLASIDGALATLVSTLFINRTYFIKFLLLFYLNPYAITVWFSAKNNVEEEFVKEEYKTKRVIQKIKTYFTYTTLVAFSNMLKIYF